MSQRVTYRTIDGVLYRCVDVGCDDLERAKRNRLIVSAGLFTTFWIMMELSLANTPLSHRPAKWIPLGSLPEVGKNDWREYGGERGGLYEIE